MTKYGDKNPHYFVILSEAKNLALYRDVGISSRQKSTNSVLAAWYTRDEILHCVQNDNG